MKEHKTIILDRAGLQKELGLRGIFGKWTASLLSRILEVDEANRIQDLYSDLEGAEFSAKTLQEIGVSYDIPEEQLSRIPEEGGFITVSNHPYGGVDGLILNAVFGARRPDMKILTTFLLARIPSLKSAFIPVDNFSAGGARSVSGIRAALGHLAEGKPLGLFPAGEVATWQKGEDRTAAGKGKVVEDKPWAENIIKLIRKSGMPVIPVYFDGGHSAGFHRLGRIHPLLRSVRLVHELFNKRGTTVKVRIGQPILPEEIAGLDLPALGKYLRNRCYALEAQCLTASSPAEQSAQEPVAEHIPAERVRAQIEALSDKILFESGDYRTYLVSASDAPDVMQELYRLREETFRAIGEGTGLALDTDVYDTYYRHMLLWNIPAGEIAGAYRLGFGPEIFAEHGGIDGFYTASLFQFREKAAEILPHTVELGRSFIVPKYQREVLTLKLLMAGVCVATARCPGTRYYIGPMSISNAVPDFYKSLIVHYIMRDFKLPDAEKYAAPTHPFRPEFLRVDPEGLLQVARNDIDAFDRFLSILSDGVYRPLPVLARKYINCNARMICFNVDPLFSYSLDGLIFQQFKDFPTATLNAFMRSLPDGARDEVFLHFHGTTTSE